MVANQIYLLLLSLSWSYHEFAGCVFRCFFLIKLHQSGLVFGLQTVHGKSTHEYSTQVILMINCFKEKRKKTISVSTEKQKHRNNLFGSNNDSVAFVFSIHSLRQPREILFCLSRSSIQFPTCWMF